MHVVAYTGASFGLAGFALERIKSRSDVAVEDLKKQDRTDHGLVSIANSRCVFCATYDRIRKSTESSPVSEKVTRRNHLFLFA